MARSFSKPNRLHVLNELNVTPMLDLCFVLLIIFMIATPVLEQTTAVNLPKADKGAGKAPDTKAQHRIVSIDRNGGLSLGARPVTTAQLEAEIVAPAHLLGRPQQRFHLLQRDLGLRILERANAGRAQHDLAIDPSGFQIVDELRHVARGHPV